MPRAGRSVPQLAVKASPSSLVTRLAVAGTLDDGDTSFGGPDALRTNPNFRIRAGMWLRKAERRGGWAFSPNKLDRSFVASSAESGYEGLKLTPKRRILCSSGLSRPGQSRGRSRIVEPVNGVEVNYRTGWSTGMGRRIDAQRYHTPFTRQQHRSNDARPPGATAGNAIFSVDRSRRKKPMCPSPARRRMAVGHATFGLPGGRGRHPATVAIAGDGSVPTGRQFRRRRALPIISYLRPHAMGRRPDSASVGYRSGNVGFGRIRVRTGRTSCGQASNSTGS